MADKEIVVEKPHICLHACAPSLKGRIKRHTAPIIIM
jgi:hypothetical protein